MRKEIFYNQNSVILVVTLFAIMLLAYEIFFRVGRRNKKADDEIKSQTGTIQAGILGLLALLLGFTFNMGLERFDTRSNAVFKEANAIRTAILQAKLLPRPYDSVMNKLMKEYVDMRIKISSVDLTNSDIRRNINEKTDLVQKKIWDNAINAAKSDSQSFVLSFISSLNDMAEARGERNALLQKHIPEVILLLLFIVFIIGGGLIGYNSGLGKKRVYIPTLMFTFLIALIVFIIIDLDRPKRGLIKVKQDSLQELELLFKTNEAST